MINKDNTAEDREVLSCSYVLSKAALYEPIIEPKQCELVQSVIKSFRHENTV